MATVPRTPRRPQPLLAGKSILPEQAPHQNDARNAPDECACDVECVGVAPDACDVPDLVA